MGIAVGTPPGLVVPVVRDCDQKTFAEIENKIADLGRAARDGKLVIADIQGGVFTISNGGTYGSLLSTPILNSPHPASSACTPSRNARSFATARSSSAR